MFSFTYYIQRNNYIYRQTVYLKMTLRRMKLCNRIFLLQRTHISNICKKKESNDDSNADFLLITIIFPRDLSSRK